MTRLGRALTYVCCLALLVAPVTPIYAQSDDPLRSTSVDKAPEDSAVKQELAAKVVAGREAGSRRELADDYRRAVIDRLAERPLGELQAISDGSAPVPPLNLGDSGADLVYTPVAPCRVLDTRFAGGPIPAGGTLSIRVAGALAGQGGAANCLVPFGPATSAVLNFVAVNPSGAGDLRAWPFGGAVPTASIVNYQTVAGLNIANGVVIPMCDPALGACASDVTIQADVAATQVVVDVLGYFRNTRKEQVRSFTVFGRRDTMTGPLVVGTCTEVLALPITAPVAGRLVAEANIWTNFDHTVGTADRFTFTLSTTSGDCAGTHWGFSSYKVIPAPDPTADPINDTLPISEIVNVAAGTTTMFVNVVKLEGAGTDEVWYTGLHITFHPN
jgi:hypothetical protein